MARMLPLLIYVWRATLLASWLTVKHARLTQRLSTPFTILPNDVRRALARKEVLDFGLNIAPSKFSFGEAHCTRLPTSLVVVYALAVVSSANASKVLMADFDGFVADDLSNHEMKKIFE